jgi:hypothetical protein
MPVQLAGGGKEDIPQGYYINWDARRKKWLQKGKIKKFHV